MPLKPIADTPTRGMAGLTHSPDVHLTAIDDDDDPIHNQQTWSPSPGQSGTPATLASRSGTAQCGECARPAGPAVPSPTALDNSSVAPDMAEHVVRARSRAGRRGHRGGEQELTRTGTSEMPRRESLVGIAA